MPPSRTIEAVESVLHTTHYGMQSVEFTKLPEYIAVAHEAFDALSDRYVQRDGDSLHFLDDFSNAATYRLMRHHPHWAEYERAA